MRIKINEENSDKVIKEPSPFSSHEHERGQVTSSVVLLTTKTLNDMK